MRSNASDWTDANSHDPGMTLLEALAYSIADLAYDARRYWARSKCRWPCALGLTMVVAGVTLLSLDKVGRRKGRGRRQREVRRQG